jgi:3-methyl-2-indolic acid synthase
MKRFEYTTFESWKQKANLNSPGDLQVFAKKNSPFSLAEAAYLIFTDSKFSNDEIRSAAQVRVQGIRKKNLLTFSPLFTTNYCDSNCLMCGMRKSNTMMERKFAGRSKIIDQLKILRKIEKTRGVGFVTGEYEGSFARNANAFWIGWGIREALDLGFNLIFCNIGSLDTNEISTLTDWFSPKDKVNLSVFQETYNLEDYDRFMGKNSPKSDFMKRLNTFDDWIDSGQKHVNPGILLGLSDPKEDLVLLMNHVEHLRKRGAHSYISVPRLRPALQTAHRTLVSDLDYIRFLATIAFLVPDCPLVLTTREPREMQQQALPIVGIVSPGSPDVAPYQKNAKPPNRLESSQFLVADLARPSEVLKWVSQQKFKVKNWNS